MSNMRELSLKHNLLQSVFVPFHIVEEVNVFRNKYQLKQNIEMGRMKENAVYFAHSPIQNTFVLYDIKYLDYFYTTVREIFPDYITVIDLSSSFADIALPMQNLQELSIIVFIGALFATIIITCLVLILFLYDRRQEIGIYLAIGEKKSRIIFQILFEITIISVIGITISLFIGNIVSRHLSYEMVRKEVINQRTKSLYQLFPNSESILERRGFSRPLPVDDMIQAFETPFDKESVLIFFMTSLSVILISITLPMILVVQINVKKILLQAKIE